MKRTPKIIFVCLLLLTILAMFLPVARFEDNSGAAIDGDIAKQEERIAADEAKLDRDTRAGKDQATLDKQKNKIEKGKAKLNDLLAQKAAMSESGSGLVYSLLPARLPAELKLNEEHINSYKVYPLDGDMDTYHTLIWITAALLVAALALALAAGNKLVSKLYTFSAFANLTAIVLMGVVLGKLAAFPIKLPYGNAIIDPKVAVLLIALPVAALFVNAGNMINTKRTLIYVFCIALSILAILPFWIMIVNGTRSSQDIQQGVSLIPGANMMKNWRILTTKNFDISVGFRNSAIIAFGATVLSVYFSALTAYGFTVYNFKGKKFLYAVVMAIIMIPGQVTSTGFFMFMYQLGLTNNFIPLIIPGIAAAGTVFFFRQYLAANFQISLVEAARIDGAGEFYTYNKIIMPIMIPAMATMGIMAVISNWNNYLTPLMLLSKPELKTLPMMVKELRGDIYRTEYGSIYLGLTMTALPLLIVYFCFSKYIIAGVAVGGVKE